MFQWKRACSTWCFIVHEILPKNQGSFKESYQVEVVLVDYNGTIPTTPNAENAARKTDETLGTGPTPFDDGATKPTQTKDSKAQDKDDDFSDNESEEISCLTGKQVEAASTTGGTVTDTSSSSETKTNAD